MNTKMWTDLKDWTKLTFEKIDNNAFNFWHSFLNNYPWLISLECTVIAKKLDKILVKFGLIKENLRVKYKLDF